MEKELDYRYLPQDYLDSFSEESVTIARGGLEATYSAEYIENGIIVRMRATTNAFTAKNGVAVRLQGVRSIAVADRRCILFTAFADGSYKLERYSYKDDGFVCEEHGFATTPNDTFYYTYEKTDGEYVVEVFASFDFLKTTRDASFGKVRLCPALIARGTTTYYEEVGCYFTQVDTWLVCDEGSRLTRNDYDTLSFAEDVPKDNKYADLSFLSELATIYSKTAYPLRRAQVGAALFSDRAYSFEATGFPAELDGCAYLCAPINGGTVYVREAGYVVLLVAENTTYDARNKVMIKAGWEPLVLAASTPMNVSMARSNADLGNWYVKYCKAGEKISLGKWAIPFAKGECEPFPWESTPATLQEIDGYYALENRTWQGVPTIAVTAGGRLFASWVSGGSAEPRVENYDTFAYSDDGGKSWTELAVIDTQKSTDKNKKSKVNDAQMWVDNDTNTLYVFYELSGVESNFEKNSAVWCFTIKNPDAAPAEWEFSEHRYCFPGLLRNNITVLSDGTWIAAPNYYMDGRFSVVYASTDKGNTWQERGKAYIPQALNFDETVVTELSDGTLWMTVRTARSYIYESFSFDKGETWTIGVASRMRNPSSRFQFFRTASGALCGVWNDDSSERIDLKVALSYDDGKTWTKPLMIYRKNSTYPDFSIDSNGVIHLIFDSGRYKSRNSWKNDEGKVCWGAIYHVALTEERIAAGGELTVDELNIISVLSE